MKLEKYLIEREIPMRNGKTVPIKKVVGYHVTRAENVDSILKNGFDLSRMRPNWVNDLAVSLDTKDLKSASRFFTRTGEKFDSSKYAILKVEVRGRFYDRDLDGSFILSSAPQQYNREMVRAGFDAAELPGNMVYVYNVKAIERITKVA